MLTTAVMLLAASLMAPRMASGQALSRLAVRVEGGVGSMLPTYQQQVQGYGLGFDFTAHVAVTLYGPLAAQLSVGNWFFPSSHGETGRLTSYTGGLRVEPRAGPGRFFVDANAGAGLTADVVRFTADVGLGYEFAIAHLVHIGPVVRGGYVMQDPSLPAVLQHDAFFWTAGLSLALHRDPTESNAPEGDAHVDTDRDGVPDVNDRCPTEPQGSHPDPRRPGCAARDTDGDGVFDFEDNCPTEPEGARPDPRQRGCPLHDQDGDGVADPVDECVSVAAGAHPDPRRPGCPATDQDGDGVLDPDDRCPTEHSGLHPDPARPGCPLPDRDHDTVPDAEDHCPDQPGAPSRDPSRNGCPGLVRVQEGQFRILRPVFFATRRDVILESSFPVLTAVADAIVATGVRRIRIEGHTDNVGRADFNLDLSRRRAASVMQWLIAHGVSADRLESTGLGDARPVESNRTPLGRAANRRVEFHITEAPQDATPPATGAPSSP